MAYCFARIEDGSPSIENVLKTKETAQLSGDGSGQVIDTEVVNAAIADAAAIADGYCSKTYSVPFDDPVPELIEQVTLDIAIFKLAENRGVVPPVHRTRYEDAIGLLKDIAADKVRLDVAPATPDPIAAPVTAFGAKLRLFGRPS